MNYLNSYLRSKLDLSHIGFIRREKESNYFCTPVQSKVIGWAGVDGIHFCTTKGFDEIIFAVSPENLPGEYVHPVARNFEDFLRLLLACYDTAAIEQCWFMDREVFEDFLMRNQPDAEGQKCLDEIRKKYKLSPMEDPFAYMHKLQEEFDYDALRFPPEYYEIVEEPTECAAPEWKVSWDGDFFDENPDAYGAEPIVVDTWFQWAGIDWYVPEVYPFDKGIVMHLLGKVDPDLVPQDEYEGFISPEVHEQMMAENPLNLQARHEVSINDIAMRPAGSMGITWMPRNDWNLESKWLLDHYGLDLDSAWQIHKVKCFWPACGKMDIQKMSLTMKQNPVSISGTHFKTPDAGNCVVLTHPQTDKEYILHIDEITQENADFSRMHDQEIEYPSRYAQMTFRIEPDMSRNQFRIVDCAQSDQPRYKEGFQKPEYHSAVSFGIIGGASTPVLMYSNQTAGSEVSTHMIAEKKYMESELQRCIARNSKVAELFEKLYEDNVEGKVTDEWFLQLSHKYEVERMELKERIAELRGSISDLDSMQTNKDKFINAIRKFMEMQTLSAPLLRELIDHIDVYETEGTGKNRTQRIMIHYKFVGVIEIPDSCDNYTADTRQGVAVQYVTKSA